MMKRLGASRTSPSLADAKGASIPFGRVIKTGSERSRAVARTVQALTAAEQLPGPSDFEVVRKPVGHQTSHEILR